MKTVGVWEPIYKFLIVDSTFYMYIHKPQDMYTDLSMQMNMPAAHRSRDSAELNIMILLIFVSTQSHMNVHWIEKKYRLAPVSPLFSSPLGVSYVDVALCIL